MTQSVKLYLFLVPLFMICFASPQLDAQPAKKYKKIVKVKKTTQKKKVTTVKKTTKQKPVAKSVELAPPKKVTRPKGSTFVTSSGGSIGKTIAPKHPKDGEGSFDIQVSKFPEKSAYLTILAFDVDEERGESTVIFFNEQRLGTLSGTNNSWDSNIFKVDPTIVRLGMNQVRLLIQDKSPTGTINWSLKVGGGQLLLDGGAGESGYIVDLKVDIKRQIKKAQINVPVQGISKGRLKLETTVIHPNGDALYSVKDEFKLQDNQEIQLTQTTNFDPYLPTGEYTIIATGVDDLLDDGTTTGFTVKLSSKPRSNVTLGVRSSDLKEITLSPAKLIFTPEDWESLKTGMNFSPPV